MKTSILTILLPKCQWRKTIAKKWSHRRAEWLLLFGSANKKNHEIRTTWREQRKSFQAEVTFETTDMEPQLVWGTQSSPGEWASSRDVWMLGAITGMQKASGLIGQGSLVHGIKKRGSGLGRKKLKGTRPSMTSVWCDYSLLERSWPEGHGSWIRSENK